MDDEQTLTPEIIALNFLSNQFVDLAAAFARRDRELAVAFVKKSEQRVADLLYGLKAEFASNGFEAQGTAILRPAAEQLREVLLRAREAAKNPPQ